MDPYGNPYFYQLRDGQPIAIYRGRDNLPGGTGEDEDWEWPKDRDKWKEALSIQETPHPLTRSKE